MGFVTIDPADIAAGKPIDNDLKTQEKDNFDALNAASSGAVNYDIPNGDMELTDASFPANWSPTTYPGGTAGLETTSPINGSQSMKFVHPGGGGNGGGYADSDYLPCGEGAPLKLSWLHSATAATMKNQVIIRWFTDEKVFVSADTIYDSIVNPAAATQFTGVCNPVSTARFYKVRLVGGESSVDVAGTALFDGVTVDRARVRTKTVSGAVSAVTFLDVRASRKCNVSFNNVAFAAAGNVLVQVSADNGATWVSTGVYASVRVSSTIAAPHTATQYSAGSSTSTSSSAVHSGSIEVGGLGLAGQTRINSDVIFTVSGNLRQHTNNGVVATATAYNAIRLFYTAVNITAGEFTLEELF